MTSLTSTYIVPTSLISRFVPVYSYYTITKRICQGVFEKYLDKLAQSVILYIRGDKIMRQLTDGEKRELGQKIKTARKQKGLSQEQLAELVGYKVGTISKYEQGYRIPDIGMLRKIASALECNLAELAGTTDDVIRDTIRREEAVDHYIAWLRGVHVMVSTPNYEDDDRTEKTAILVDVDGVVFDIGKQVNEIMEMGKEHFKLLAKQFGKNIFEE